MAPRPVKKPVVTTKSSEKVLRKRAPPNRRRLKINPPKHPCEDEDIVQEEEVLAIENKDESIEVSLYNIFKKKT